MPGDGESRTAADVAVIYAHVHVRVIELVAGCSLAEVLYLGDAWRADDDRAQKIALAGVISSTPDGAEAFIRFCEVEAATILRSHERIVRALAEELLIRRTMTGEEVDTLIAWQVSLDTEYQRRWQWQQIVANAARFCPEP